MTIIYMPSFIIASSTVSTVSTVGPHIANVDAIFSLRQCDFYVNSLLSIYQSHLILASFCELLLPPFPVIVTQCTVTSLSLKAPTQSLNKTNL